MRDDHPQGGTYPGFESGLRAYNSPNVACEQPGSGCKPAYRAFRTPLVVTLLGKGKCTRKRSFPKRRGKPRKRPVCVRRRPPPRVSAWGRVRPATASVKVIINRHDKGKASKRVAKLTTNSAGYFFTKMANRAGRRWTVRWQSSEGPKVSAFRF